MSGGRYGYQDKTLLYEMFGYEDKRVGNPFEDVELSQLFYELLRLVHDLDWYQSGDTGEVQYLEAKNAFKKKWLRNENYEEVLKDIIEEELEAKKQELMKMI